MVLAASLLLLLCAASSWGQWDRFRGPNGSGAAEARGLPAEFGSSRNLIWRVAFPPGHSSPIVSGDRIFLTGVEDNRLYTFSVKRETGETVWKREAPRSRQEKLHSLNNPASPTPVSDGRNVYVFFPDFGLLSYTWDGSEVWRLPLGPFSNIYGVGVSPVLADGNVVLVIDQNQDSFILAVDKATGKVSWRKPRPEALSGASTPIVVPRARGGSLVLAPSSFRMDVYSAKDGDVVWWLQGLPSEMKSVPIAANGMVYISGFNTPENDPGRQVALPRWEELLAKSDADKDGAIQKTEAPDERTKRYWPFLDIDGNGKLDAKEWKLHIAVMAAENGLYAYRLGTKGDATANLQWKYQRSVPQLPSVLLYKDVLYMINDRGVLTTLDPRIGNAFKQARLRGVSDNYYASPVAGDDKVYFASHSGVIAVVKAGADQEVLAENKMDEEIFATPAIANDRLYVRTVSALYCFGKRLH